MRTFTWAVLFAAVLDVIAALVLSGVVLTAEAQAQANGDPIAHTLYHLETYGRADTIILVAILLLVLLVVVLLIWILRRLSP